MRNSSHLRSRSVEAEGVAALVSVIVLASLSVGLVIGAGLMRALGAR